MMLLPVQARSLKPASTGNIQGRILHETPVITVFRLDTNSTRDIPARRKHCNTSVTADHQAGCNGMYTPCKPDLIQARGAPSAIEKGISRS
jgi:hypothetical protein